MAEEKEESKNDAPKEGMSVKKLIIILFSVFILILGVIVGLLVYLLAPKSNDASTNESNVAVEEIVAQVEKEEVVESVQSFFYTIRPPFTVNFIASRNAKFLRVSVDLVVSNEDAIDHIEDNLPFIKNDLVALFSSKSFDELKTSEGKEQLRAEALDKVQTILKRESGKTWVKSILFTSFVMD